MFDAFIRRTVHETALRQLEERLESKIALVKTEWMQYLVSIEDVHDKIDHIVKRHAKRKSRELPPPDSVPEPTEGLDEVSLRVAERRNRGVSTQQG